MGQTTHSDEHKSGRSGCEACCNDVSRCRHEFWERLIKIQMGGVMSRTVNSLCAEDETPKWAGLERMGDTESEEDERDD
jgi:hypothetical protein